MNSFSESLHRDTHEKSDRSQKEYKERELKGEGKNKHLCVSHQSLQNKYIRSQKSNRINLNTEKSRLKQSSYKSGKSRTKEMQKKHLIFLKPFSKDLRGDWQDSSVIVYAIHCNILRLVSNKVLHVLLHKISHPLHRNNRKTNTLSVPCYFIWSSIQSVTLIDLSFGGQEAVRFTLTWPQNGPQKRDQAVSVKYNSSSFAVDIKKCLRTVHKKCCWAEGFQDQYSMWG